MVVPTYSNQLAKTDHKYLFDSYLGIFSQPNVKMSQIWDVGAKVRLIVLVIQLLQNIAEKILRHSNWWLKISKFKFKFKFKKQTR